MTNMCFKNTHLVEINWIARGENIALVAYHFIYSRAQFIANLSGNSLRLYPWPTVLNMRRF